VDSTADGGHRDFLVAKFFLSTQPLTEMTDNAGTPICRLPINSGSLEP
jgi:hypothetical protein